MNFLQSHTANILYLPTFKRAILTSVSVEVNKRSYHPNFEAILWNLSSRSLRLFIYYPLLDWASNLRIYFKRWFSICLNLLLILSFATISSVSIFLWLQNAYQRKWRLVWTLELSIKALKLSFICFIGLRENMPVLFDLDENFVLQMIHHFVEFVTCFAAKLHVVNQCNLMLFRSLYFDARENYLKWFRYAFFRVCNL